MLMILYYLLNDTANKVFKICQKQYIILYLVFGLAKKKSVVQSKRISQQFVPQTFEINYKQISVNLNRSLVNK